jgi:hypothetical protein
VVILEVEDDDDSWLDNAEVNLQTGKVIVRRLSGLRPPRPRALRPNLNVATKDKPLSRKS